MLTDCYGHSISSVGVIVLYINVISNIYNLIIISLIKDSTTELLLGPDFDVKQDLIIFETIVLICGISISCIQTSSELGTIFNTMKFWIFGITFIALFVDIMLVGIPSIAHLLSYAFNNSSRNPEKELALFRSYFLWITIALIIYFVLKIYAFYAILSFQKNSQNYRTLHNENDNRNTSREDRVSIGLPPPYDQCIVELGFLPPPYYSVV